MVKAMSETAVVKMSAASLPPRARGILVPHAPFSHPNHGVHYPEHLDKRTSSPVRARSRSRPHKPHQVDIGGSASFSSSSSGASPDPTLLSSLASSNNSNNKRITSNAGPRNDNNYNVNISTHVNIGSGSAENVSVERGRTDGARKLKANTQQQLSVRQLRQKQQQNLTKQQSSHLPFQLSNSNKATQPKAMEEVSPEMVTIEEVRRSSDGSQTIHKYHRGKLLGKGGFAKVYWCTSLDTQKAYAIKIVPKANLVKSRARQKLQAEIKIHRTLKHNKICEFKHFFEDRTNCYILLELCQNQTLNELIKRRKRLTEPEVIYFMLQLNEGVQYMHSNNVIHRDLKLGNLFLDVNLNIKIGDLGLATKLANTDEKRNTICGTPNYIAPEVIDGNKSSGGHSFEVDIWALGVIMYALLIGKPPYEAKDVKTTYQRILNNEYKFPNGVLISDNAKHLITGMLQTRPEDRPTLSQVRSHPFFTHSGVQIPRSIPLACIHAVPVWRENENGELVADVDSRKTNPFLFRKKKLHSGAPQALENQPPVRRPLSTKDHNQCHPQIQNDLNGRDLTEKRCKSSKAPSGQLIHAGQLNKPSTRNDRDKNGATSGVKASLKFKIYNENGENERPHEIRDQPEIPEQLKPRDTNRNVRRTSQSRRIPPQKENAIDELADQANAFSLEPVVSSSTRSLFGSDKQVETSVPTNPNAPPSDNGCSQGPTADNDLKMLESMHSLLARSFCKSDDVQNGVDNFAAPTSRSLKAADAMKWVTRYVDYTSKYGLGFLLNDGSAGVYFNDSTKAVLAPDGETFQYVERRRSQQSDGAERREPPFQTYTLTTHPESLQKKVTLLKHFRNYLLEQQLKTSVEEKDDKGTTENKNEELVYLKKWVRTRHAILFRLSNRTVQVVFHDHTEVLLSCEERVVTYVDKSQKRSTYPINEVAKDPTCEIAKRLKYSMDILHQLISGAKR